MASKEKTFPKGSKMAFKKGDRVVYPHHGAAIIEDKKLKTIFGSRKEYLILRMVMDNMTLSVPADKAEEVGMRWPISGEDVDERQQEGEACVELSTATHTPPSLMPATGEPSCCGILLRMGMAGEGAHVRGPHL